MKHYQLLIAMRRIVEGIEIEREVRGGRLERLEEQVDQDIPEPPQVRNREGVLEAGQGRLTGQVGKLRETIGDHLEDRIRAEGIVVVLVLVVGEDAVDPLPHHAQEGLFHKVGIAVVLEGGGEWW